MAQAAGPPPTPVKHEAVLPSGAKIELLNQGEVDYVNERVQRYGEDNVFRQVSDQQDLDRMIAMEAMSNRWHTWLSMQQDYEGGRVDEMRLRRDWIETSRELRQLKKSLGIDKVSRDKQKGEGSVHHYIAQLGVRAKAMGLCRNEQAAKSIELAMQLIALVTFNRNAPTEDERKELGYTDRDILDWIWESFRPQMEAIDMKFRTEGPNAQAMWIRQQ